MPETTMSADELRAELVKIMEEFFPESQPTQRAFCAIAMREPVLRFAADQTRASLFPHA